ncbi:alginate O-acetyltransferase AlgX-related protein [Microvirga flavescens]|uniref:alginate O-acetyltransferase AlgX-related protein n=1 Tax=Microvirga flavescens TaxID=2249811 RepID=UPI000DD87C34|nr:hypothetical protein [Microvirga flavescens]
MKQLLKRPVLALLILLTLLPGAAMLAQKSGVKIFAGFTKTSLGGVVDPAPPPKWTLTSFLDGNLQKQLSLWVPEQMGRPRETMLRLNNGLGYVMGRSFNPDVIIGRNRMLYPKDYVREWCSKPRPNKRQAEVVNQIVKLRDDVTASGKRFLLVLSPGKPSIYSEYLKTPCDGDSNNRRISQIKTALAASNVEMVDGTVALRNAKRSQNLPLFGRDGLHWNALGASFTVNAIVDNLERQLGKPMPRLKVENMTVDSRSPVADQDLGALLNLPFRLWPYPSPHPVFDAGKEGYRPRILMVGTSFCWQLLDLMGVNRISDDLRFYYYFSKIAQAKEGNVEISDVSFAAGKDLPAAFERAEVVVLEINEANVLADYTSQLQADIARLLKKGG